MTDDDVRYRLRAILHRAEIAERFDFILLDCPPRLTTGCVNALAASDYVMIPVLPNPVAAAAVPRLLRWLRRLRKEAFPELSVMGVVGNKAKFFRDSLVKKQQAELDLLPALCQEQWGEPIRFFPGTAPARPDRISLAGTRSQDRRGLSRPRGPDQQGTSTLCA